MPPFKIIGYQLEFIRGGVGFCHFFRHLFGAVQEVAAFAFPVHTETVIHIHRNEPCA